MIRTRNALGVTKELGADVRFLEILSADHKLAVAVWLDAGDVVHLAQPGDRDFDRYMSAFGLEPSKIVDLAKVVGQE